MVFSVMSGASAPAFSRSVAYFWSRSVALAAGTSVGACAWMAAGAAMSAKAISIVLSVFIFFEVYYLYVCCKCMNKIPFGKGGADKNAAQRLQVTTLLLKFAELNKP